MTYSSGSSGYGGMWSTDAHGSARWMTAPEANTLRLFEHRPDSIILGQNENGDLACFNGSGHVLVLAPPRTGKGIGFVQPNLLGYRGSMVVTDPKGENVAVSYRHRTEVLGQKVVVLDPSGKLNSYNLTPRIPTHGFNPLSIFADSTYAEIIDDLERIADALLVVKDEKAEEHWRDGARSFLKSMLTYMVFFMPKADHNLIKLSRLVNDLDMPREDIFLALTRNLHRDPIMRDVISRQGAWWSHVNVRERASFVSIALRSMNWLNSPIWHSHLTTNTFSPSDLKAGKTTLYIVCPFEKLEDYSPWFRLVLSSCILAILRTPNRSPIPTLFMLDEYAATIGRLSVLEQAIPYIEGMGGRFAFIFQYLSQMQNLWPDPQYHGIFASAGAHVFFNVNDKLTSEYLSSYIGKNGALSLSSGGASVVQRDLLSPDEVRTLPSGDLIAFLRGSRPAWLLKLDVRSHPLTKRLLSDNPVYQVHSHAPPLRLSSGPQPMLNVDETLRKAKGDNSENSRSKALVEQLRAQHPGKTFRIENGMVGFDEMRTDPTTGQNRKTFVPLMRRNLIWTD